MTSVTSGMLDEAVAIVVASTAAAGSWATVVAVFLSLEGEEATTAGATGKYSEVTGARERKVDGGGIEKLMVAVVVIVVVGWRRRRKMRMLVIVTSESGCFLSLEKRRGRIKKKEGRQV